MNYIEITDMTDNEIAVLLGVEVKPAETCKNCKKVAHHDDLVIGSGLCVDCLEEKEEFEAARNWAYGGGYEASQGDYEGACLARAEYEAGQI